MNLNEILKRRYSCRSYINKNIDDDTINEMINNAILSPNAGNLQSWRFVIVKEESKKQEIICTRKARSCKHGNARPGENRNKGKEVWQQS